MSDVDIIKWLTGGSVFVSAIGYAAWWGVQRGLELWRRVDGHGNMLLEIAKDVSQHKAECDACRRGMQQRLDEGTGEFKRTREDWHKTRLDILENAKESVEKVASLKDDLYRGFITEATFKDRVLSEMTKNCKNFEAK